MSATGTNTGGAPSTVEFIVPIGTGKEYTTVSAWITACKSDLTDATNKVADVSALVGDWSTEDGAAVTNRTRTGTATVFHVNGDTSQAYFRVLTGSFLSGDVVEDNATQLKTFTLGSDAVQIDDCVAEIYQQAGGVSDQFNVQNVDWTGDATHRVIIRAASSNSYRDHVHRYGNALTYDASLGAAVANSSTAQTVIVSFPYTLIQNLQARY
jgi:hypothetical protein